MTLAVTACIGVGSLAHAAEVGARLGSDKAYVGVPVQLQITVANASTHEPPNLPSVPGLDITLMGTPSVSSQTTIINGRRSHRESVTYVVAVTPRQAGDYVIPAMTIEADGQTYTTRALHLVAEASETGDLMFAEIEGAGEAIYVGEPLPLTLRIGIRPFVDEAHGVELDEEQMWSRISQDHSQWGIFSEAVSSMARQRRRPTGREVTRRNADGQEVSYFVYEVQASAYPNNAGTAEIGNVQIVAAYPVSLEPTRDFFGRTGLRIAELRPITASAASPAVLIKPIPQAGRPDDFRGAVGRYTVEARATPLKARVGDPIHLAIRVRGDGPMHLLPAPPLAELPELTESFKLPDEPLAGVVHGDAKVFTTTIRPKSTDVIEVPPIPYSYFDPGSERFVTVTSEPIPITVERGKRLDLSSIVAQHDVSAGSHDHDASGTPAKRAKDEAEIVPVFYGNLPLDSATLAAGADSRVPWLLALLAGPAVFAGFVFAGGVRRVRTSPKRLARQRIAEADSPDAIAATVRGYAIDRFALPAGSTRQEIVDRLRQHHCDPRTLDTLLSHCEDTRYAPVSEIGPDLETLRASANRCIQLMENA